MALCHPYLPWPLFPCPWRAGTSLCYISSDSQGVGRQQAVPQETSPSSAQGDVWMLFWNEIHWNLFHSSPLQPCLLGCLSLKGWIHLNCNDRVTSVVPVRSPWSQGREKSLRQPLRSQWTWNSSFRSYSLTLISWLYRAQDTCTPKFVALC